VALEVLLGTAQLVSGWSAGWGTLYWRVAWSSERSKFPRGRLLWRAAGASGPESAVTEGLLARAGQWHGACSIS
jgi:hypothetical protein